MPIPDEAPPGGTRQRVVIIGCLSCSCLTLMVVLPLLACGAFGGVGIVMFVTQVRAELNDNPVVQEHLGEIETLRIAWTDPGMDSMDDQWVFHATGTRGRAKITVVSVTVDAYTERIESGRLELPSGEVHDLIED